MEARTIVETMMGGEVKLGRAMEGLRYYGTQQSGAWAIFRRTYAVIVEGFATGNYEPARMFDAMRRMRSVIDLLDGGPGDIGRLNNEIGKAATSMGIATAGFSF